LQKRLERKGTRRGQTRRNKGRTSRASRRARFTLQPSHGGSSLRNMRECTLVPVSALEVIKYFAGSCCGVRLEVGKEKGEVLQGVETAGSGNLQMKGRGSSHWRGK